MGSGTDLARESADVLLLGNDLERFAETVRVARSCRRIIFQNFGGTILVDLVGIALAAAGRLSPLWAAAIHVGSELAFLMNSARLLAGHSLKERRGSARHFQRRHGEKDQSEVMATR